MEYGIKDITGCVMALYLLYCAVVINRGNIALLDTGKVQRFGSSALAFFAAGFLYDVTSTT